jgi:pSer/pThr/pTyr-binding forkhead associated (FHA) protein
MQKVPTLVGIAGHVEGAHTPLEYGKTIVVGRSRAADLSLRRIPAIAAMSDEEREADHDLRTVSGKHFEITMYNANSIEVVNLSPNGTYVDGKLVDKMIIEDAAENAHEIRIGKGQVFSLEMASEEEAAPAEEEAAPAEADPPAEGGPGGGSDD